jgi:hypothetical protein
LAALALCCAASIMVLLATSDTCLAASISPAPTPSAAMRLAPSFIPPGTAATPRIRVPPHRFPTVVPPVITPAPAVSPTPATAELPRILGVRATPNVITVGETAEVIFQASILDPSNQIKQVRLRRLGAGGPVDLGALTGSASGRLSVYQLSIPLQERYPGTIEFQVVAAYQPPAVLYSYSHGLPQIPPSQVSINVRPAAGTPTPVVTPAPVVPPPTDTRPISQRNDLGIRVRVPAGWRIDESLQSLHGPLNINTFNSQYVRPGGIIPPNQASIDITRVRMPSYPEELISNDLEDSTIRSRDDNFQIAGSTGKKVVFTDSFAPGLSYDNVAIYVPHGKYLYKFFLTYYKNDTEGARFMNNFQEVLDSVEFIP